MTVREALEKRRSIKDYDPNLKLTNAEIKHLFELAILSPSSFNLQHWRFAAITDQEVKNQLWEVSWQQNQVKDASLVVMITAESDNVKDASHYWRNAPQEVRDMLVPMIEQFYGDINLNKLEAVRSGSLAAMSLMLAATEMGYDSCPMIGFDQSKAREILDIPASHEIVMMITVGKGIKEAQPKGGQLGVGEVVFLNKFSGETLK